MVTRKAILIGIKEYEYLDHVHSADSDVTVLAPLIENNEDEEGEPYRNFEYRTVTSTTPQKLKQAELRKTLSDFLKEPADYGLVYYTGHGVVNNHLGGFLAASDSQQYNEGIPFQQIMQYVSKSPIKELVIILDCCYSGSIANVDFGETAIIREGVTILASSGSLQESKVRGGSGVFTKVLCGALKGGAADTVGKITVAGLYSYIDELFGAFEQRPYFKSHLSRMFTVRQTKPALPIKDLKKVTTFFETPEAEFEINTTFEETEPDAIEENVAKLKVLQKYRAANLIVPKHEEHIYWELKREQRDGCCILTYKGKFYWQLVRKNAITR